MWPWQRNGEQQPSHTLVRRLLVLSSIGHTCLLMLLFVFYHDDATRVSRDVIAVLLDTDVTIVQVPLTKVMHKSAPIVGSGKSGKKASSPVATQPKKEALPVTSISKPKEPKVAIAKAKKVEKQKKETKSKKEIPKLKEPEKPKIAKAEPKKIEEKKIEEKKVEEKKSEIVQQVI